MVTGAKNNNNEAEERRQRVPGRGRSMRRALLFYKCPPRDVSDI